MVDSAGDGTGSALGRRGFLSATLAAVPAVVAVAPTGAEEAAPPSAADGEGAVARLLRTPSRHRDVRWIRRALQIAVAIEMATIPPYLCAWWSIEDRGSEPARLIRGIVGDEMFHMGLACNLLTAVGGRPRIVDAVPAYPGPLPGGVRRGLTVYLSGLSKTYVRDVLMEIEAPEEPLAREPGAPTIGQFYSALQDAFRDARPHLVTEGQLASRIGPDRLRPVATLADAEQALETVKEQGEGTSASPDGPSGHGEPAHYYAFGEIYHERRVAGAPGRWGYEGDPVPFPEVHPMGTVPAGGWRNPSPEAARLLERFDLEFTRVVHSLEGAWANGDRRALDGAVQSMRELAEPALELMALPLPDGTGVYGPQFHVLSRPQR